MDAIRTESWPLGSYPLKDPSSGKAVSSHFKMAVLDDSGRVVFHKVRDFVSDEEGKKVEIEKQVHERIAIVSRLKSMPRKGMDPEEHSGMVDKIPGADIRMAEEKIGCKPHIVLMGLYGMWNGLKWVMQDPMKTRLPLYWVDVTEAYYKEWRELAYEGMDDPFAGQLRPYSRVQKLEKDLAESEAKLAAKK